MITSQDGDLKSFHDFLAKKVQAKEDISPEEAMAQWYEHLAVIESIKQGIADADAGRTTPADEALRVLRERLKA